MKSAILIALLFATCLHCFSQAITPTGPTPVEGTGKIVYNKQGKPSPFVRGVGKGKVAVINCQNKVKPDIIDRAIDYFKNMTHVNIVQVKCLENWSLDSASKILLDTNSEAAIFVVDDNSLPTTLTIGGANWGVANVARIAVSYSDDLVLEKRFKKVFARTFGYSFGAGDATPMMGSMIPLKEDTIEEIDNIPDPSFTPQGTIAIKNHLMLLGIYGERLATYRKACEEGWAPEPINEAQSNIWNKVHAIPANPMKIEFDPKKGR